MSISFQWFYKTFDISTNDRTLGFHEGKKEVKIWIVYLVSKIASKKLKLFQKAEVMLGANVLSLASPSDLVVNLK